MLVMGMNLRNLGEGLRKNASFRNSRKIVDCGNVGRISLLEEDWIHLSIAKAH